MILAYQEFGMVLLCRNCMCIWESQTEDFPSSQSSVWGIVVS